MPLPQEIVAKSPDLERLCTRYFIRRLELIGSAASGRFDPARSDFDFLVTFEDAPQARSFNTYFDFMDELQRLFSRRVDLIEQTAIRNPALLRSIRQNPKETVYAAKGEGLSA